MLGASRGSMAAISHSLDARLGASGVEGLSDELFAVAGLLSSDKPLRNALADGGQPVAARQGMVTQLLSDRIGSGALEVIVEAVACRWSSDMDLVLAVERLAAQAAFALAAGQGNLDATEEELFRFGRAVDSSAQLQMALTDSAQSAQTKSAIVHDLLNGRATQATSSVLQYSVGHLHGRRIDSVVDELCNLAAAQRDRVVAEVRVAAPIDDAQAQRLAAALSELKGRQVRLNVAVDPTILGGVLVTVGDEVIDGTIASRLEEARRAVIGS